MRKEYDFSKMKGRRNPHARHLKKQVTIRMGVDILEYFKELAQEAGSSYESLIDRYLTECAEHHRRPHVTPGSRK